MAFPERTGGQVLVGAELPPHVAAETVDAEPEGAVAVT